MGFKGHGTISNHAFDPAVILLCV